MTNSEGSVVAKTDFNPHPSAWALQCHVCTSSTNCLNPQVCSANSYFCKTVTTGEWQSKSFGVKRSALGLILGRDQS